MFLEKGQKFTLRDGGKTLGTGVITNIKKDMTAEQRELMEGGKKAREKKAKQAASK